MDREEDSGAELGRSLDLTHEVQTPEAEAYAQLLRDYRDARILHEARLGNITTEQYMRLIGESLPDADTVFPMNTGQPGAPTDPIPPVFPLNTGEPGAPTGDMPQLFPMTTGQPMVAEEEGPPPLFPLLDRSKAALEKSRLNVSCKLGALRDYIRTTCGFEDAVGTLQRVVDAVNKEIGSSGRWR